MEVIRAAGHRLALADEYIDATIVALAGLSLPVLVTRQYPKGLGPTDGELADALPGHTQYLDKTCFSGAGTMEGTETLRATARNQVVICGMEAHVCVIQTVADLAAAGYEPVVVADGVCSRDPEHADNALARMRAGGVSIANRESVVFEWLRDARHEKFKAVSNLIK